MSAEAFLCPNSPTPQKKPRDEAGLKGGFHEASKSHPHHGQIEADEPIHALKISPPAPSANFRSNTGDFQRRIGFGKEWPSTRGCGVRSRANSHRRAPDKQRAAASALSVVARRLLWTELMRSGFSRQPPRPARHRPAKCPENLTGQARSPTKCPGQEKSQSS